MFFQQKLCYFQYILQWYEARLTENGISPEPNLCCYKLNILD